MTILHVGKSTTTDTRAAVRAAIDEARQGVTHPAFALVLSTDLYDHDMLAREIQETLGPVPWAGSSCAGVIAGDEILARGLVVGIVDSATVRVGIGHAGPVSADGQGAGRAAAAMALDALPPPSADRYRALILLCDVLAGNGTDIVRGAAEEVGTGVVWAGGGGGSNREFRRTAQYANGAVLNDEVIAVFMDTAEPLATGVGHGWRPYGPPMLVTRAEGPIAVEFDYENAFEVYQRVAARHSDVVSRVDFATFARTHPLGIPQANGEHVIRDPLGLEGEGGLRCVAEIPEGCIVRVMEGNRDMLLAAGRATAENARTGVPGPLGGAFVFDCISRAMFLGDDMRQELLAFAAGLGPGVPLMGCLTFGEVGASRMGMPQFHNKAVVMLALGA